MKDGSNRRKFLKSGLAGLAGMAAGCSGQQETDGGGDTPTPRVETVVRERTKVVERTVVKDAPTPEESREYELFPVQTWMAQSRTDNPQNFEWGTLARRNLERLGMRFEWDVVESGTWADRLFSRDWDFCHLAWSGSPERIYPYYNLFFSFHSQFAEVGKGNFELWASDDYDEAVENFISAVDEDERQQWAYRCQEIIGYNEPVTFSVHPDALIAASTRHFTNWTPMFGTFAFYNHNNLRAIESKGSSDTVVYATTRPMNVFPNYWGHTGPDMLMAHNMYLDALFYPDFEGQPQPMAADPEDPYEWQDNTTVTVNLRQGMQWHDGEPVTADDVHWSWQWLMEHEIPYLGSDMAAYDSSRVIDDHTIEFSLSRPFSGFIQIPLFRMKILPRHVWEGTVEEYGVAHPRELQIPRQVEPIGSGPFEWVKYDPQQRFIVEKNPDHYWADDYEFDTLIRQVYSNQSSLIGDMIDGEVSCAQFLAANHWERANNAPSVNAIANPNLYTTGIWVQCNKTPWTDVLVRRALAHAVDDQAIIDFVFRGHGGLARSPVAPANEFYFNVDTPYYRTNLSRARELLAESGFRWDDRGRLMIPTDWEPTLTYVSPEDPDEFIVDDPSVVIGETVN